MEEVEEVSVISVLKVFSHWKVLIIVLTVVAMIASYVVSTYFLKPRYKGSAIILVAEVGSVEILNVDEVQSMVKDPAFLMALAHSSNAPSDLLVGNVSTTIPKGTATFSVAFESSDKSTISSFFDNLVKTLNSTNNDFYNIKLGALLSTKNSLENEWKGLQEERAEVLQETHDIDNAWITSQSLVRYSSLLSRLTFVYNKISDISLRIISIEQDINNSHEFMYAVNPIVSDQPVFPNVMLNIAIAGLGALFLSILLAFMLESIKQQSIKQPAES